MLYMDMPLIEHGHSGKYVLIWQTFLQGEGLYKGKLDEDFGNKTYTATRRFQAIHHLFPVDGRVGTKTWGMAFALGMVVNPDDYLENFLESTPPAGLRWTSPVERESLFGRIAFKLTPTKSNPEAITITNNWVKENIELVYVPQLSERYGVHGAHGGFPKNGKIYWHKKYMDNLLGFFAEVEKKNRLHYIKTWAGSWAPRTVRGGSSLSNHAYATAFDINAAWNGLGRRPAPKIVDGTVIPLVDIAAKHGFWWGGWGWGNKNRLDGMHFEIGQR